MDKIRACRMCKGKLEENSIRVKEMMFGTGDVFHYQECVDCGSLQIADIPDNLGDYYPDNYYSMSLGSRSSMFQKIRERLVIIGIKLYFSFNGVARSIVPAPKRADLLALAAAGAKKEMSILDVGCGSNPDLLNKLHSVGFSNLTGVDPFINSEGNSAGKVKLYKKNIKDVEGTFDILIMNHSFEHVPEPLDDILTIPRLLNPKGKAVIRIPTPSSKAYKIYKSDWVQLDAPRHLNLPSRLAMESMINMAGLTILSTFDDSSAFQFYGSEFYKRGLPLSSTKVKDIFSTRKIKQFQAEADRLNEQNLGDQVTYILERA